MSKDTLFLSCRVQKGVGLVGQLVTPHTKRRLSLTETETFLLAKKYVRDIIWGQKIDLDLLELIMKPTDLVEEEFHRILMKMNQFTFEIKEFRVSTCEMPRKI